MPACFNTHGKQSGLASLSRSGFTLVELLVVVAIIGVLATIGVTVFTGARSSANNAKAKADIDSIRKAYEGKYDPISGTYAPLTDSDFTSGKIPTDVNGGSYIVVGPTGGSSGGAPIPGKENNNGFAACVSVSSGTRCGYPSVDCYCTNSIQGQSITIDSITNLITNPNFETNTSGWGSQGINTLSRDTSQFKEGVASLKSVTVANGNSQIFYQVALKPSTTYSWNISVLKGLGTENVSVSFRWLDASQSFISDSPWEGSVIPSTTWQIVTTTITSPPNAAFAQLYILITNSTAGNYHYFDSAELKQISY